MWFLQPARPSTAKLVGSVHARRQKKYRFLSPDVGVYIHHISNIGRVSHFRKGRRNLLLTLTSCLGQWKVLRAVVLLHRKRHHKDVWTGWLKTWSSPASLNAAAMTQVSPTRHGLKDKQWLPLLGS